METVHFQDVSLFSGNFVQESTFCTLESEIASLRFSLYFFFFAQPIRLSSTVCVILCSSVSVTATFSSRLIVVKFSTLSHEIASSCHRVLMSYARYGYQIKNLNFSEVSLQLLTAFFASNKFLRYSVQQLFQR